MPVAVQGFETLLFSSTLTLIFQRPQGVCCDFTLELIEQICKVG